MSSSRDTEITLGVGKLLGLFFALVALCGLSLGIGYWLGWNSAARSGLRAAASPAANAPAKGAADDPGSASPAPAKASDCEGADCGGQAAQAPENSQLTFYQSVQQNDPQPKLTGANAAAKSPPPHTTLSGGYLVQIAAVTRQDDAKLLQSALEKERYPVLITAPGDKLFHVQVGPYANLKEAEEIRTRLIGAGYRAYLKH